jgi:hypothetical protein
MSRTAGSVGSPPRGSRLVGSGLREKSEGGSAADRCERINSKSGGYPVSFETKQMQGGSCCENHTQNKHMWF